MLIKNTKTLNVLVRMQNNILLTLNVLCQVLRDIMLSFPDLRGSGLKWLWDSRVLTYFYIFVSFFFFSFCVLILCSSSDILILWWGEFFCQIHVFPCSMLSAYSGRPHPCSFKRCGNVALRHGLVMGLAVLELGVELMILKGLFQSKSMNFCEMPLVLVKQLEFQWNLFLLI